ncbi:hypothetical protein THAOC_15796 [Thalassiosira oceanica]|uniref:Uncharacterized protein n=1 Tax=Thalassiosira oceanica TaxID=159749 RepID=K0SZ70_THAOC|nr:hypothetical protein THAOC_15796 [Thalassiosira oceanica]|eukprot:EJK63537.1 hypothetical protein THAOC_15796 [Thalassiosira oceanica]
MRGEPLEPPVACSSTLITSSPRLLTAPPPPPVNRHVTTSSPPPHAHVTIHTKRAGGTLDVGRAENLRTPHDANAPAYHHQQPRLDGLLLVKGFMELTFGVSVFWGLAGGRAGGQSCTARYQKEGITTSRTDKNIKSDQTTLWPYPPVRTVPVGVGAAHVAPLMRGDLAGPQMKQSGAASTSAKRRRRDAAGQARRRGWGAKVVGNEREGRAKGGAGRRQRKSAGLARGVGWVGARVNTGHLAAQPTRPLVCVWFVQLSLGGGGAEVVATGERGVGWVGARVDRTRDFWQRSRRGRAAGLQIRTAAASASCVAACSLGLFAARGACETGGGGGWGHGWARAGGAVHDGTPKKGSQK